MDGTEQDSLTKWKIYMKSFQPPSWLTFMTNLQKKIETISIESDVSWPCFRSLDFGMHVKFTW